MPPEKANLVIVEDDIPARMLLSAMLAQSGYRVRSAEDGFSALVEIRKEIPDIILSDLNMPGMSGFELLSVVRRRFPAIRVIAMSGMPSGGGLPPGVAADAFYEKATTLASLLQILEAMSRSERPPFQHPRTPATIWIPKNGHDSSGNACITITCPECLRTYSQVLSKRDGPIHETGCVHCQSLIHYAIVQRVEPAPAQALQRKVGTRVPTLLGPQLVKAGKKEPLQCAT